MQSLPKHRISEVKPDVSWGLYMWRLPNGRLLQDGSGNYLNIPAHKNDLRKMAEVKSAARDFGKPEGELHFEPGVARATDSERQEQEEMLVAGEMLPNDFGAIADELRGMSKR